VEENKPYKKNIRNSNYQTNKRDYVKDNDFRKIIKIKNQIWSSYEEEIPIININSSLKRER
jgi:hypothetical protein